MKFTLLLIILLLFQPSQLSAKDREPKKYAGITKSHNIIREKHNIPPLQWSNKLAKHAQQWANYLAKEKNCAMIHRPRSGKYKRIYGENIYWASPVRMGNGKKKVQSVSPAKIVSLWAAEEKYYNHANNRCKPGKVCGHYTQIVWKRTTQVGCGMAVGSNAAQIWVCNYNPLGNYIGQKPY
ncbi:MAG: CAP domain-containing protein [Campylobacterota bacterium]|nr:CAP domain-containing protein [Campylobacterota bacterium]